jgi:hypothetical protein
MQGQAPRFSELLSRQPRNSWLANGSKRRLTSAPARQVLLTLPDGRGSFNAQASSAGAKHLAVEVEQLNRHGSVEGMWQNHQV